MLRWIIQFIMSHIGSKSIPINKGIEIKQYKSNLYIKGKLGVSKMPNTKYVIKDEKAYIYLSQKNFWGTFQSITSNIIKGVTFGFRKRYDYNFWKE